MKAFLDYITEAKTLVDKLNQLDRITKSFNEICKRLRDNNDELTKNWVDKDGNFDLETLGKQGMMDLALLYKVCKEFNIAPYTVCYKGNTVFHDLKKDKPFYLNRETNRKIWLKPESVVNYLNRPYEKSQLKNWVYDKDVEKRVEEYRKKGYYIGDKGEK